MEDFNDAFETIDTQMKARNCQFYMTSYTGNGESPISLTFPRKPLIVFIMGEDNESWMCGFRPATFLYMSYANNRYINQATWEGNTLTWPLHPGGSTFGANSRDRIYYVLALLDADS